MTLPGGIAAAGGDPLFALRETLRAADGGVSAAQLAAALGLSRTVVDALLAHWQRRGRVVASAAGGCGDGGSCAACASRCVGATELYRWHDTPPTRTVPLHAAR